MTIESRFAKYQLTVGQAIGLHRHRVSSWLGVNYPLEDAQQDVNALCCDGSISPREALQILARRPLGYDFEPLPDWQAQRLEGYRDIVRASCSGAHSDSRVCNFIADYLIRNHNLPSRDAIAEGCSVSVRQARYALATLQEIVIDCLPALWLEILRVELEDKPSYQYDSREVLGANGLTLWGYSLATSRD